VIRTLHRTRGASAIGAAGPGQTGPFGIWPEPDEDDDVGQDDEPVSAMADTDH
jgi:hypothetical protein